MQDIFSLTCRRNRPLLPLIYFNPPLALFTRGHVKRLVEWRLRQLEAEEGLVAVADGLRSSPGILITFFQINVKFLQASRGGADQEYREGLISNLELGLVELLKSFDTYMRRRGW